MKGLQVRLLKSRLAWAGRAIRRWYDSRMHPHWDTLIVDLDGTLLNKDGEVSDRNMRAYNEVCQQGIEVIIATGRCYAECSYIMDCLGHTGVSICAGGSTLHNESGQIIQASHLPFAIVEEVAKALMENNHRCLLLKDNRASDVHYVLVGNSELHDASKWWFDVHDISYLEVNEIDDDPWKDKTVRAGAVACESMLDPIARNLETQLGDRATMQHWSAVTSSEATGSVTHLLEVFGRNVSKWSMLETYFNGSVNKDRVVAIGDGLNDVELLKGAGLSIAMENATEFVKSHAQYVCGHHEQDGFASAVESWILST